MFQELKEIDKKEITRSLHTYILERGMDEAVLKMELEEGETVESLICTVCGRLLADIIEREQTKIRKAQQEGIRRARENGKVFGRPKKDFPPNFQRCYKRYRDGIMTSREAAKLLDIPSSTFRNMVLRYETAKKEETYLIKEDDSSKKG